MAMGLIDMIVKLHICTTWNREIEVI